MESIIINYNWIIILLLFIVILVSGYIYSGTGDPNTLFRYSNVFIIKPGIKHKYMIYNFSKTQHDYSVQIYPNLLDKLSTNFGNTVQEIFEKITNRKINDKMSWFGTLNHNKSEAECIGYLMGLLVSIKPCVFICDEKIYDSEDENVRIYFKIGINHGEQDAEFVVNKMKVQIIGPYRYVKIDVLDDVHFFGEKHTDLNKTDLLNCTMYNFMKKNRDKFHLLAEIPICTQSSQYVDKLKRDYPYSTLAQLHCLKYEQPNSITGIDARRDECYSLGYYGTNNSEFRKDCEHTSVLRNILYLLILKIDEPEIKIMLNTPKFYVDLIFLFIDCKNFYTGLFNLLSNYNVVYDLDINYNETRVSDSFVNNEEFILSNLLNTKEFEPLKSKILSYTENYVNTNVAKLIELVNQSANSSDILYESNPGEAGYKRYGAVILDIYLFLKLEKHDGKIICYLGNEHVKNLCDMYKYIYNFDFVEICNNENKERGAIKINIQDNSGVSEYVDFEYDL